MRQRAPTCPVALADAQAYALRAMPSMSPRHGKSPKTPTQQGNLVRRNVLIEPGQAETIQRIVEREGRTEAQVIRRLLAFALAWFGGRSSGPDDVHVLLRQLGDAEQSATGATGFFRLSRGEDAFRLLVHASPLLAELMRELPQGTTLRALLSEPRRS